MTRPRAASVTNLEAVTETPARRVCPLTNGARKRPGRSPNIRSPATRTTCENETRSGGAWRRTCLSRRRRRAGQGGQRVLTWFVDEKPLADWLEESIKGRELPIHVRHHPMPRGPR